MSETPARYDVVEATVTRHLHYGLVVVGPLDLPGYVDSDHIRDWAQREQPWPEVGSRIRGVVLGYTSVRPAPTRLRVTARPGDIALVESVDDPDEALRTWRDTSPKGARAAEVLLRSAHAIPLLRWALTRAPDGDDHRTASAILADAPPAIREQCLGSQA
ncbi:hypothetical protein [Actinokineospora spheciospongiae]|uniref:hypothetical protein n=1 Tax=Actinokineospora spheciospongiae TaxID=909613 RepID=UPI00055787F2|nr:hypothetical protein [Actinokineospora spheciospongiae]